jgi:tetratricopeptide (TPR) repeat protein
MSPLCRSHINHQSPALACFLAAILYCFCAVTAAEDVTVQTAPTIEPPNPSRMVAHVAIADVDVLALNDEFKGVLDTQVNSIRQPSRRVLALHELLFGEHGYDIRYQGQYTRTAMETLTLGSGNCVSLANLYVAAARHVGLDARFQEAHVPEDWEESASGYYVVPGHINVLVKLRGHRDFTVEFLSAYEGRAAKTRILSDDEAVAQYYNNLGMKHLHEDAPQVARQYLKKALQLYDRSPLLWSNMGVIKKHLGQYKAAEAAYLTSLKYDDEFLSAIKNLYVLYMQTGEAEKAARYAEIVEAYNRRNPYYLEKLANIALNSGDYEAAIELLKQAVDIKESEDRFHFTLAKAYYFSGDLKRATEAMEKAREVATSPRDQERYRNKLAALESIVHR